MQKSSRIAEISTAATFLCSPCGCNSLHTGPVGLCVTSYIIYYDFCFPPHTFKGLSKTEDMMPITLCSHRHAVSSSEAGNRVRQICIWHLASLSCRNLFSDDEQSFDRNAALYLEIQIFVNFSHGETSQFTENFIEDCDENFVNFIYRDSEQ